MTIVVALADRGGGGHFASPSNHCKCRSRFDSFLYGS